MRISARHMLILCGGLLSAAPAIAQSLGGVVDAAPAVKSVRMSAEEVLPPAQSGTVPPKEAPLRKTVTTPAEKGFFMPGQQLSVLEQPTADGSKRGGIAFYEVDEQGRRREVEKIFLYYEDFKISRSVGGVVTCDVRLIVSTNLDRKLISLDAKLVWPGLTTTISFANIPPNTPTYYNYTLLGEGCYSMDKMPNIIVNRCRVRGMSSAECAAKITWLKNIK